MPLEMVQTESPRKIIIKNVEYEVCECCNKPKRGSGKSLGGVAFFVCKAYIKSGRVIDFPDMWKRLCEACGFEHVETIHAWQTEDKGTNFDFEGEAKKKVISRKSFFRQIYEKKYPENSIDFETVLILRKL